MASFLGIAGDAEKLRTLLAGLPLPRFEDGRPVLAGDVSPWLRSDAPCSADRLFCHVYGRAKSAGPGLGPTDQGAAMTSTRTENLSSAGHAHRALCRAGTQTLQAPDS